MISYEKLWATMKEKGVSQYALIKKYGVSPGQITRMKRNESVSTHTIEVFCKILDCDVGDIMEYIAEDKSKRRLRPPGIRKHTPQKARFAQPCRCAALTDIQYACGGAPRLCTKRALFRCEAVLPK